MRNILIGLAVGAATLPADAEAGTHRKIKKMCGEPPELDIDVETEARITSEIRARYLVGEGVLAAVGQPVAGQGGAHAHVVGRGGQEAVLRAVKLLALMAPLCHIPQCG